MAAIRRSTSVKYGHTCTQFRQAPGTPYAMAMTSVILPSPAYAPCLPLHWQQAKVCLAAHIEVGSW